MYKFSFLPGFIYEISGRSSAVTDHRVCFSVSPLHLGPGRFYESVLYVVGTSMLYVISGVSGQAVQPNPLASLKLSMAVYGQKLDGRPSR